MSNPMCRAKVFAHDVRGLLDLRKKLRTHYTETMFLIQEFTPRTLRL